MSVKIYHNPRCSKSRQTLALLQEQYIEIENKEYLKNPPNVSELDHILTMLDKQPLELMRTGEEDFKTHFNNKNLTRDESISFMVTYPKVIERPIVINGDKAAIGRPPESVLAIL